MTTLLKLIYSSNKFSPVRFLVAKSPLYLTKTWQVVNYLMCFDVGMLAFRLKIVISITEKELIR
jgi:hypothetical protein